MVTTKTYKKYLDNLQEGDKVLAWNDKGDLEFSEVWVKTHHLLDVMQTYYQIDSETKRLLISPGHFILVKRNEQETFIKAMDIKVSVVPFFYFIST